jgi:chromosome segregation ATPase
MVSEKTLFDDNQHTEKSTVIRKEGTPLEKLKNLEDKIATAIERVKTLKDEKILLQRKIRELEELLDEKNHEIEHLRSEKNVVKSQIEDLLTELEMIEAEKE